MLRLADLLIRGPRLAPGWLTFALVLGLPLLGMTGGMEASAQVRPTSPTAGRPGKATVEGTAIVAVVNGEVISQGDVEHRRRLFAVSTGLPVTQDVLDRLTPQVIRQLIDERLRLQEAQRRHIVVGDKEIFDAISEIESRNGMPVGTLRRRLSSQGVELRTLIDQIRVQIGWGRVLKEVLGPQLQVSDNDIKQQENLLKAQVGQTEYRVGEIFVPVSDPSQAEDARRFADTVIEQLRAGAPFAVMAAQFSQSQTALSGGDIGWVQQNQLDTAVLRVLNEMPVGAISNPIAVPGGFSIVTLRAKREVGREMATVLSVRQVFYRFQGKLNPAAPTPQQREVIEEARRAGASWKSCDEVEAAAKAAGDPKGGNPGDVILETVAVPALRQLMATQPLGKISEPLIADDGVAMMMICSREQKNLGVPNRKELADQILNERIELASRQLMRDLQRRALIDRRV